MMVEEKNLLQKLEIEFIDMENIYKEVFDGTPVKDYTKEQLLDFIDDVLQLFDSVIGVVSANWKNLETIKRMLSAADLIRTLEDTVNVTQEDEQEEDNGIFI